MNIYQNPIVSFVRYIWNKMKFENVSNSSRHPKKNLIKCYADYKYCIIFNTYTYINRYNYLLYKRFKSYNTNAEGNFIFKTQRNHFGRFMEHSLLKKDRHVCLNLNMKRYFHL